MKMYKVVGLYICIHSDVIQSLDFEIVIYLACEVSTTWVSEHVYIIMVMRGAHFVKQALQIVRAGRSLFHWVSTNEH